MPKWYILIIYITIKEYLEQQKKNKANSEQLPEEIKIKKITF